MSVNEKAKANDGEKGIDFPFFTLLPVLLIFLIKAFPNIGYSLKHAYGSAQVSYAHLIVGIVSVELCLFLIFVAGALFIGYVFAAISGNVLDFSEGLSAGFVKLLVVGLIVGLAGLVFGSTLGFADTDHALVFGFGVIAIISLAVHQSPIGSLHIISRALFALISFCAAYNWLGAL